MCNAFFLLDDVCLHIWSAEHNNLNPWAEAGVLEKKADDIKVEHKEPDDNALYSSGPEEVGCSSWHDLTFSLLNL